MYLWTRLLFPNLLVETIKTWLVDCCALMLCLNDILENPIARLHCVVTGLCKLSTVDIVTFVAVEVYMSNLELCFQRKQVSYQARVHFFIRRGHQIAHCRLW